MVLRFMEGFEVRRHSSLYEDIYDPYTGINPAGSDTGGRKQGTGMAIGAQSILETPLLVSSPENDWVVQFAVRKSTNSNMVDAAGITMVRDSGGDQIELRMIDGDRTGTFKLELLRGLTSLAVTGEYSYGGGRAWHVFQMAATIHPTTGSVNVKHWDYNNNVTTNVINVSGINTALSAAAGADKVRFSLGTLTSDQKVWDDLVVMDGTGSVNNAQTSVPILVYGQQPATDGTVQWDPSTGSNHAAILDDDPDTGGDGEEVTSDTLTELDQFTMTPVPEMPDTATPAILGVMVDIRGGMKNSGSRTLRVNIDDPLGGNADVATDLIYSTTNVESRILLMDTNPVSTVAWTLADLEDHLFGFKLHA